MSVVKSVCFSLLVGICLVVNIGCTKEDISAEDLYKKANKYYEQKDYKNAMQWYLKAADKGDARAMNQIGFLYGRGQGVERSDKQSMYWLIKSADNGGTNAMVTIGTFYYVSSEFPEAMQWYLKAADKGDINAMRSIAILYAGGYGVKQDKAQAELWYKKAEKAEEAKAKAKASQL